MKKSRILLIAIAGVVLPLIIYSILLAMGKNKYNDSCAICHQMRQTVKHKESYVHRKQLCKDCHAEMSSLPSMFAVYFKLKQPVRKALDGGTTKQCVKCHAATWNKEHVFDKSILFSHVRHSRRVPGCTACHSDVSHPREVRASRPLVTSATCAACHAKMKSADGQKPPSSIPDLGVYEKQPHPKNWLILHKGDALKTTKHCDNCHSAKYCSNCHLKFRLHGPDWRLKHGAEAQADLAPCQLCHLPEGCADCHAKKLPKSHGPAWAADHRKDFKVDDCMKCHRLNFCQSCHVRSKPSSHTDTMIRNHEGVSKGNEKVCALCHNQNPCMDCHKIQIPHTSNWIPTHKAQAKTVAQRAVCSNCHKKEYCAACHEKKYPTSHLDLKKWAKTHGKSALQKRSDCALCHKENFCESCHRTPMPHAPNWRSSHSRSAVSKPATCDMCHQKQQCRECHKNTKPASHTDPSVKFPSRHGDLAKRNARCDTCHDPKKFCENCHGISIPHSPALLKDHRASVKEKGKAFCSNCHKPDFCKDCHTKRAKHPAGWLTRHGAKASGDAKSCMTCHSPSRCLDCHSKQVKGASGVHPDCTFCHDDKTLKFNGVSNTCAMCHDDIAKQASGSDVKKDCALCHKPHTWKPKSGLCADCHNMKKSGLHEKSDHSDCANCHKRHGWKPAGRGPCETCHGDKKDHNAPEPCWSCHPFN